MALSKQNQLKIDQAVTRLYHWLQTWRQEDGAYNSFVVHRCDLKRLKEIHETPWGHCAVIEGLIQLYEKKKSSDLCRQIEDAVRLQISRLTSDADFKNAGFEDDRFSSLVHNSMADRALLCYYSCSIQNQKLKAEALRTVRKNVDDYLLGELWKEQVGAFRFSRKDYYSPDVVRYVANMNCVAVEVLLMLYRILQEEKYLRYARKCGEWLKTQSVCSNQKYCDGGISYGSNNPECLVSIYTGLCLPGICELYRMFGDEAYKNMAIRAAENLLNYTEDGYFCHAVTGDEQRKYPFFLAGAGIILFGIEYVNAVLGQNFDLLPFLKKVLQRQYRSGAVQNFMHYNSGANGRLNANENMQVWEDIVPCLPWNAQLFRYLTKISSGLLNEEYRCHAVGKVGLGYLYAETEKWLIVCAIYPVKSIVFLLIHKKRNRSLIAFSFKQMVGKMREKFLGRQL